MKTKNLVLVVILGAILILGGCACKGYNGIVSEDVKVNKAWSDVQTEYQNRNDLVGNLVNTVKGAANFEQSTLTAVIEARAKATSVNINADNLTPEKMAEFQAAQGQLSSSLSRLLVSVEAYPTLKATENFTKLQGQLEGIENNIKNSRKVFNETVQSYNMKVRTFPMNLFAGMFGFKQKAGFQSDPGAEKAPEVKF
ncbi:MAG: LemA family protein [Bacteroidota bacterium]